MKISAEQHAARFTYPQVFATLSVSLVAMVIGYSLAYTGSAMESLKENTSFELTVNEISWIAGIINPASAVGSLFGGLFIDYMGRKNIIGAISITIITSWLLVGFSTNAIMVIVGRAISGFCVGVVSLSVPVYLSETVQSDVRGMLVLTSTAFSSIGILLCFVSGIYMKWSMMAFTGGAISIPFLIFMFLIPESPLWCVSHGHKDRARKALVWLNGKKFDVEPELQAIIQSHSDAEIHSKSNIFSELFKRSNLKPLLISIGLMLFQQLSGITIVMFYAVGFFYDAGLTNDVQMCSVIVSLINFIATIFAIILIDKLGRKLLLYLSNIFMIITLIVIGGFAYAKYHVTDLSYLGWLPFSSFVIYIFGYSIGFGPIPWLMMSEILPAKIRGPAAGITTAFQSICAYFVTKFLSYMMYAVELYTVIWLCGSFCVIGFFFIRFCVPETKGKTLEDIEHKITGRGRSNSLSTNIYPQPLKA